MSNNGKRRARLRLRLRLGQRLRCRRGRRDGEEGIFGEVKEPRLLDGAGQHRVRGALVLHKVRGVRGTITTTTTGSTAAAVAVDTAAAAAAATAVAGGELGLGLAAVFLAEPLDQRRRVPRDRHRVEQPPDDERLQHPLRGPRAEIDGVEPPALKQNPQDLAGLGLQRVVARVEQVGLNLVAAQPAAHLPLLLLLLIAAAAAALAVVVGTPHR
jgi:hypothetical protein